MSKHGDAIIRLTAALSEKERELARLKGHTWCAYCGQEYLLDTVSADQIGEHIRTCHKHPMRATERHLEAVEEQNGQLKQELAALRSHVRLLVAAHDAKLSCEVESLIEELRIGGKFPSINTVICLGG